MRAIIKNIALMVFISLNLFTAFAKDNLVTDLSESDAKELNNKFTQTKNDSFGYQFISIQSTPYIEEFAGFWILRDIVLIS